MRLHAAYSDSWMFEALFQELRRELLCNGSSSCATLFLPVANDRRNAADGLSESPTIYIGRLEQQKMDVMMMLSQISASRIRKIAKVAEVRCGRKE